MGAGTVLNVAQAEAALAAGARFIVAPGFDPAVVDFALRRGVPIVPGVCTPTEVGMALARGLALVKLFPAEAAGGVAYLKALAAPFGGVRFVPTGGIGPDNLAAYLAVEQVVACGGSWMVKKDLIAAGAFDTIRELAATAREIARAARPTLVGEAAEGRRWSILEIRAADGCRWDLVALGEVMLRLDPGEGRVATTRSFDVCEGGGEYNVARGLRRCFGLRTALVSALADNPVGRLLEDLILGGGVDQSHVRWVPYDGVGRAARNGLNFTERGFGVRGAVGCSDRGHTAVSQLRSGDIDWETIFAAEGARWFHCGGIFAALGEATADVATEAMVAARRHGAIVSYDLNYRPSLWRSIGGQDRAREVNRAIAPLVDVMLGNEEDFSAALGFEVAGLDREPLGARPRALRRHDGAGRRRVSQHPRGGDHAARRRFGEPQRLECGRLGRRRPLPFRATPGARDPRPGGRR